jgi:hypothetical protein
MRVGASERDWRNPAIAWSLAEQSARIDAARHMLADLPDPRQYAHHLPLHLVEALTAARKNKTYGWMVGEDHAAELRSLGLVGFGRGREGQGVTAFGWAVRRALLEDQL